jgi:LCP family protein required for cell wall assembly
MMILGIDYAPTGNFVGRSDTIVLMTFEPFKPYVGILSVPRDLWVPIPGFGENRINTAHFFAEAQSPGSGPAAVRSTIRENFGLDFKYYLRVKFESFRDIVNAMGGLDIVLTKPMAGYPAGKHHLTGNKALAFARNRIGSDDFFRMERGQLLLKSAINQVIRPTNWRKIPAVLIAFWKSIDTNIPVWLWPRLAVAMIRTGSQGWNAQTIEREMVSPYTTNEGANVLIPNWDLIRAHSNRIFSP